MNESTWWFVAGYVAGAATIALFAFLATRQWGAE